jgi:hypothetical protein
LGASAVFFYCAYYQKQRLGGASFCFFDAKDAKKAKAAKGILVIISSLRPLPPFAPFALKK